MVAGAAAILRSCDVGGSLTSTEGNRSTLGLTLADVFNTVDLGAITPVAGLPNRLNLYHALASVNTVSSALTLSAESIASGTDTSGGLGFADIGFTDDTVCDAHGFQVTGGADAASFSIGGDLGNQLVIDDGVLNIDTKGSFEVEITVTDFYGAAFSQLFTIGVFEP